MPSPFSGTGYRLPGEINVSYPLYGISGAYSNGTTKTSQILNTKGAWRVLVMMCITAVNSSPSPLITLQGYSAADASDFYRHVGPLTAETYKRYVSLASAPGRECFWFDVFAPFTKVRVSLDSGVGDTMTVSGHANSRPWIVLQKAPE